MASKFEIIGNALVVTDDVSGEVLFDHPSKETYFDSDKLTNQNSILLKLEDGSRIRSVGAGQFDLSDSIDSTDTPFTINSFRDFARVNLG